MMKTHYSHPLYFVLLVLLIASLACSSATPTPPDKASVPASTPGSEPAMATSVPATETIKATSSKPTKAPVQTSTESPVDTVSYLGDAVLVDGYSLTALSLEDPAKPGMFYQAKKGTKLVAVDIVIANLSGDSLSINPFGATLVDAEGFTYTPELVGVDDQIATNDINKGEKVRGWVAFQIPTNAVPAKIKYSASMFGGTELIASLTQPPTGHTAAQPTIEAPVIVETFLGDAMLFHGYALTGISIADPAKSGMFYKAKFGTKLIGVEIILSNLEGDPLDINPMNTVLVDEGGFTYQAELGGMDEQIPTFTIQPGERVRGWVAFQIPEKAKPVAIKYAPDLWGEAFKVGLTQPPTGHIKATETASSSVAVTTSTLGQAVKNNSFSLTGVTLQDPAKASSFTKVKAGMKMVGAEIILENLSDDALSINPMNALLVDSQGFVYSTELGGMNEQLATLDLAKGEKVRGWVAFMIPKDAVPTAVKYGDTFGREMLSAGLTK